jgi:hypothetical protein
LENAAMRRSEALIRQQKDLFTRRWRSADVTAPPPKEVALHIQLASMLRWCIRPDVIWRHVPNGEHRDPRTAAKLKAMGVLPGSADLEFFWKDYWEDSGGSHTALRVLFLELKAPGNKPTPVQVEFALAMRLLGAEYHWTASIDRAIALLGERGLIRRGVTVCGVKY